MGTRVLVIDNYDSFVYNLVQELGELGADPVVHRNDAVDVAGIRAASPDAILISPGPGRPESSRHQHDRDPGTGRRDPHPRGMPRTPGHRRGLRGRGGGRTHADARQDLRHPPRRPGRLRRPARPLRGHPVPLLGGRAGQCPRRPGGDRPHRRRGHHGPPPPHPGRRGGPVPPRVAAHPRRAEPAVELPGCRPCPPEPAGQPV